MDERSGADNDFLLRLKNFMGANRHTPFNEELQAIFESDNLALLEGANVGHIPPQLEAKTEDDQNKEK